MVARMVRDHKVVGSNPVASTKTPVFERFLPENGAFLCVHGGSFAVIYQFWGQIGGKS